MTCFKSHTRFVGRIRFSLPYKPTLPSHQNQALLPAAFHRPERLF